MKWIGQHIWDFISRFRSEVYLEDVAEDNSLTEVLVRNPYTGLVKRKTNFDVTGGGTITVLDTNDNAINDVTTIQVYDSTGDGTGIEAYDNGGGVALIAVPPAEFASPFSIDRTTTFSDWKKIAGSVDAVGKKFWAGDWNNSSAGNDKWVTDSYSTRLPIIYDTTGQYGSMEGSSKIEVRIYGPEDNTSSGAGNEIGTATHTIAGATSGETYNADGIKIKILEWDDDVIPTKNKARVKVEFDPSYIPDALQSVDTNFSGSQKYYSVKIWHTDSSGNTLGNIFWDDEFFFDGAEITPGNPNNLTIDLKTSSPTPTTMYLSNIRYYDEAGWEVTGDDITDLARDTRSSTDGVAIISPSGISTDSNNQINYTVSNHDGTTDDDVNDFSVSFELDDNIYYLSQEAGATVSVYGGMGPTNSNNEASSDDARAYNTYSTSSQANTSDTFRSESHRLPHHNNATWNVTNINQAMLETYAGTDNLETDGRDLLVQTQHNGNTFKLEHPDNISTIAASPVQERWGGHTTPGSDDWAYYYRYFELSNFGGSLTFAMVNVDRAEYKNAWDDGYIEVHFSRPTSEVGNNNTWIPLDPDKNYNSNRPTETCYNGGQPTSTALFNIQFDSNPKNVAVRVKMKGSFTTGSRVLTGLSLNNLHS